MTESSFEGHIRSLNACNQRGGRMLTLVDLVNTSSIDVGLAAYLAAMMRNGASVLVGAKPGGAGKTAVMVACLNFLPDDTIIKVTDATLPMHSDSKHKICYLAHEIGAGSYYAYIWGQQARDFFRLIQLGYTIASNLHTDTLGQLVDQLCGQNKIPPVWVGSVTLKIFLRMRRMRNGKMHRWVSHVYENDGVVDNLVWTGSQHGLFSRIQESKVVEKAEEQKWHTYIRDCQKENIVTIEGIRRRLLET